MSGTKRFTTRTLDHSKLELGILQPLLLMAGSSYRHSQPLRQELNARS